MIRYREARKIQSVIIVVMSDLSKAFSGISEARTMGALNVPPEVVELLGEAQGALAISNHKAKTVYEWIEDQCRIGAFPE